MGERLAGWEARPTVRLHSLPQHHVAEHATPPALLPKLQ